MELRKTLCHPYTISPELEPMDVTPAQAQANLTEASAKFMLLASMLPKLKAAGHRVLIVSHRKCGASVQLAEYSHDLVMRSSRSSNSCSR